MWLQVLQGKALEAYRNTFANLALPLFAMSEPVPAKRASFKDMEWTLWDRWVLEGDLTVQVLHCLYLPLNIQPEKILTLLSHSTEAGCPSTVCFQTAVPGSSVMRVTGACV